MLSLEGRREYSESSLLKVHLLCIIWCLSSFDDIAIEYNCEKPRTYSPYYRQEMDSRTVWKIRWIQLVMDSICCSVMVIRGRFHFSLSLAITMWERYGHGMCHNFWRPHVALYKKVYLACAAPTSFSTGISFLYKHAWCEPGESVIDVNKIGVGYI